MTEFRVPDDVLRASRHGEEVFLNPASGEYHAINQTGERILQGLERGQTVEEIVDEIATSTGEAPDRIRTDTDAFLEALLERGLLLRRGSPPPP